MRWRNAGAFAAPFGSALHRKKPSKPPNPTNLPNHKRAPPLHRVQYCMGGSRGQRPRKVSLRSRVPARSAGVGASGLRHSGRCTHPKTTRPTIGNPRPRRRGMDSRRRDEPRPAKPHSPGLLALSHAGRFHGPDADLLRHKIGSTEANQTSHPEHSLGHPVHWHKHPDRRLPRRTPSPGAPRSTLCLFRSDLLGSRRFGSLFSLRCRDRCTCPSPTNLRSGRPCSDPDNRLLHNPDSL